MKHLSQADAQKQVDDIFTFQKELDKLEKQEIITLLPQQRASIYQYQLQLLQQLKTHNDIDINLGSKQLTLTMKILTFLGAIAFSLSIGFFIEYFWGYLNQPLQAGLLISITVFSLTLTYCLDKYDYNDYLVKLASLISLSCFMFNIFISMQIDVVSLSNRIYLERAIYALVLAYFSRFQLTLMAALACLSAYIAYLIGYVSSYPVEGIEILEHYLVMGLCWAIPLVFHRRLYADFDLIYRLFGLLILFIPILILAISGDSYYLNWERQSIEDFYYWVGLVSATVFIYLGIRYRLRETINIASAFFTIFLYLKIYHWCWEYLPKYLFFLLIGFILLLLLLIFKRIRLKLNQGENHASI